MKTFSAKASDIRRDWFVIDAENVILGRLATEVAHRLRGKHKAEFTAHMDTGDNIIVINADKIKVTGKKLDDKIYYSHSGYPGGLKSTPMKKLQEKRPERIIELAIKGMLPKNPLGRQMYRKLKVYAGSVHPHEAQQPQPLKIKERQ